MMDFSDLVIGIHGKAGAGKDTAAMYLNRKFGMCPIAFADPIKKALVNLFGSTYGLTFKHFHGELKERSLPGLGKSPRELMQSFGTEWGRDRVNTDVWIKIAKTRIKQERHTARMRFRQYQGTVISDVRFENEAEWIRSRNGLVVHVDRPDAKSVRSHTSEFGIEVGLTDIIIRNTGTFEELEKKLYATVLDVASSSVEGLWNAGQAHSEGKTA